MKLNDEGIKKAQEGRGFVEDWWWWDCLINRTITIYFILLMIILEVIELL